MQRETAGHPTAFHALYRMIAYKDYAMTKKKSPNQRTLDQAQIIYEYNKISVIVENEDVWLSQKQIAELFGVDIPTINYHIKQVTAADGKVSVIRKIRITAADGKVYEVSHYGLDTIIPIGYRVGSPQAAAFRVWANGILKEVILLSLAIHERKQGSKALLKMEKDLNLAEKYKLGQRPEIVRLSHLYENKLGEELLFAIIADICLNPNYGQIKGAEYKYLFGMLADDLKKALGTDKIRPNLPNRQLKAFTLAEETLRLILSDKRPRTNEEVMEAVKIAFVPIGQYLRGTAEMLGLDPVTDKPLLQSKN